MCPFVELGRQEWRVQSIGLPFYCPKSGKASPMLCSPSLVSALWALGCYLLSAAAS